MIVRPWTQGDTERLNIQTAQRYLSDLGTLNQDLSSLAEMGLAWSAEADDHIVAIAGLYPQWENRAIAWALIGEDAGKHFIGITRGVKRMLDVSGFRRIEATIDVGFEAGVRWMWMLGFEFEGRMKAYRPDGADMLLYARVR